MVKLRTSPPEKRETGDKISDRSQLSRKQKRVSAGVKMPTSLARPRAAGGVASTGSSLVDGAPPSGQSVARARPVPRARESTSRAAGGGGMLDDVRQAAAQLRENLMLALREQQERTAAGMVRQRAEWVAEVRSIGTEWREELSREIALARSEVFSAVAEMASGRTRRAASFLQRVRPEVLHARKVVETVRAKSQTLDHASAAALATRECAVCLEGFTASQAVVTLRCAHTLHFACLEPWLLRNGPASACPTCKRLVLSEAELPPAPDVVPFFVPPPSVPALGVPHAAPNPLLSLPRTVTGPICPEAGHQSQCGPISPEAGHQSRSGPIRPAAARREGGGAGKLDDGGRVTGGWAEGGAGGNSGGDAGWGAGGGSAGASGSSPGARLTGTGNSDGSADATRHISRGGSGGNSAGSSGRAGSPGAHIGATVGSYGVALDMRRQARLQGGHAEALRDERPLTSGRGGRPGAHLAGTVAGAAGHSPGGSTSDSVGGGSGSNSGGDAEHSQGGRSGGGSVGGSKDTLTLSGEGGRRAALGVRRRLARAALRRAGGAG